MTSSRIETSADSVVIPSANSSTAADEDSNLVKFEKQFAPPPQDSSTACVSSFQFEQAKELCCIHTHRTGTPPPDGKCCYHRCRPTWTREQRARNYGEMELLSQPSSNSRPDAGLRGMENR